MSKKTKQTRCVMFIEGVQCNNEASWILFYEFDLKDRRRVCDDCRTRLSSRYTPYDPYAPRELKPRFERLDRVKCQETIESPELGPGTCQIIIKTDLCQALGTWRLYWPSHPDNLYFACDECRLLTMKIYSDPIRKFMVKPIFKKIETKARVK